MNGVFDKEILILKLRSKVFYSIDFRVNGYVCIILLLVLRIKPWQRWCMQIQQPVAYSGVVTFNF